MAAYRRVYDSRHMQADCQEPGSVSQPYARQSSMGYLYICADPTTLRSIADRVSGKGNAIGRVRPTTRLHVFTLSCELTDFWL